MHPFPRQKTVMLSARRFNLLTFNEVSAAQAVNVIVNCDRSWSLGAGRVLGLLALWLAEGENHVHAIHKFKGIAGQ